MANLPACPPSLKPIAHFLKTAQEHDGRDPVVAYWCRLYGLQSGLKLSSKLPEETALLIAMMDWLDKAKKEQHENEAITNDVVAQAYLENYALKLFTYADLNDRGSNFNKNVVKAYYTAGVIYDTLLKFGELSEEATDKRKYSKYKAAYIHNCLKNGETPIPGPPNEGGESDDNNVEPSTSENAGNEDISPPPAAPSQPNPEPSVSSPIDPTPPIDFQPHPTDISADKLPSPPVDPEDKNPGGFQSYVPTSALNFDDVKSAIDNLEKALHLLTTGQEK